MKRYGLLLLALLAVCPAWAADSRPRAGYRVVNRLPLGGEGGWDYVSVDETARRIYVARATRVMVLNADSGALLAEIPGTTRVHGVALAEEFGRAFISNGGTGVVAIVDLKTLKQIGSVKAGENPDAIFYHAGSKRVFVFNGGSHDATVIDAANGKAIKTIALSGKPEFAVQDAKGMLYVNIEDKNSIAAIDPGKLAVVHEWPMAGCEEPTGLAIDRKNGRLFSACSNQRMMIVEAASGRLLGSVPIGRGCDGAAFDPSSGHAFAANGEGTLTVIAETRPGKYETIQTLPTQAGGRTIGFDPATRHLLVPAAKFGPGDPAAELAQRPPMVPGSFELLVISRGEQKQ